MLRQSLTNQLASQMHLWFCKGLPRGQLAVDNTAGLHNSAPCENGSSVVLQTHHVDNGRASFSIVSQLSQICICKRPLGTGLAGDMPILEEWSAALLCRSIVVQAIMQQMASGPGCCFKMGWDHTSTSAGYVLPFALPPWASCTSVKPCSGMWGLLVC